MLMKKKKSLNRIVQAISNSVLGPIKDSRGRLVQCVPADASHVISLMPKL